MTTHKTLRTLLLCALYAFVLLFFLSSDSYLRDIFGHFDSAIFFMCGKAWMNGMIPYVDFADSKGPLLWLIYGIGYLLNHHSYVGVFWISVVFYTATLYIAYKLCRLYIDAGPSALCTALLPFVIFFDWFHNETHAEDFCFPFIMFCLYGLCRVIKEKGIPRRTYFWLCAGMGVSFMACLLMKWNVAIMLGSLMLCVFILSFKQKVWALCIGGMLAGAVVLALPFVIYFLAFADFGAMVQEYFLNTFLTVEDRSSVLDILTFDKEMFMNEKLTIALLISLLLSLLKYRHFVWFVPCLLFFRACLGGICLVHYYNTLTPFALFFIIAAIAFIFEKLSILRRFVPLWCLIAAVVTIVNDKWLVVHVDRTFLPVRQQCYGAAYIMSQVEKPKVFWYRCNESVSVLVDALPSCRYWTIQAGATKEMWAEREVCLKDGTADFIISNTSHPEDIHARHEELIALGYVLYTEFTGTWGGSTFTLYGRPGLKLPPEDFHVSQWDVWLKRNIFGI